VSLFKTPNDPNAQNADTAAYSNYTTQTSVIGGALPIVIGKARLAGNVIWIGDWTSSVPGGNSKLSGKGSGGGKGGQTYNYTASFGIVLCQGGPAPAILGSVWKDRSTYVPEGVQSPTPGYFSTGLIGQSPWPYLTSSKPANQALGYSEMVVAWYENANLGSGGAISNYSYEITGQAANVGNVNIASDGVSVTWGGDGAQFNPLIALTGTIVISGLTYNCTWHSPTSLTLSTSYGGSATGLSYSALLGPDALVSDAITFMLTNFNCANMNPAYLGSMAGAGGLANYCIANGLGISPIVNNQDTYSSRLTEWLLVCNSEAFSSEGLIKFATYGDTAITGNGVTFTPNLTPVYTLGLDDFVVGKNTNSPPVQFSRVAAQDINNRMVVEWTNRGNQYNTETMDDEDTWSIDYQVGQRNTGSTISVHSVCLPTVAQQVLTVQLKRNVYMTRKASFTLGWAYSILEPMDLVQVPEQYPSTDYVAVRILTIDEDDNGNLAMTGEVLPFPILTPSLYQKQQSGGFTAGFNALPGSTNVPVFFEATQQMLNQNLVTQLTLFIALSGGPNWGGCAVYASTDGGASYDQVGTQNVGSQQGSLTASLAAVVDTNVPDTTHTLSVNLQESLGDLDTYTQAEADNNVSLCVVDQELMSWKTATLTGSNAFNLTYLRRGVFGSPCTSHASGAFFAQLSGGEAFQFDYQPAGASGIASQGPRVGQTIYFKFPAFNLSGQQQEETSAVTAYPYTLTAPYVRPPLSLKPYSQVYSFAPSGYGYTLAQQNGGSSVEIEGTPPVNSFSKSVTAPSIDFTATVSANAFGLIPAGTWVAQVFAIDSSGLYSTGSNLTEFVSPGFGYQAAFSVSWSSSAVAYEIFTGTSLNNMFGMGKVTPGSIPSSLTLTSIANGGYGPPDQQATNFHARAKQVIHGGIAATTIVSSTFTTVVINCPSAPASNEFANRQLILVSRAGLPATQSFPTQQINGNDTGTPLCTLNITSPGGSFYNPGDLVIISTYSTSSTQTSINDTGLISPFAPNMAISAATNASAAALTVSAAPYTGEYVTISGFSGSWAPANGTFQATNLSSSTFSVPVNSTGFGAVTGTPIVVGGLTPHVEKGNLIRVFIDPTGSASPSDPPVTIVDNTNTGWTTTSFLNVPGNGTIFIEEEPTWRTNVNTVAAPNSSAPVLSSPETVPLISVPTTNLQGLVALVELLAQNVNGLDSAELGDGLRMLYIVPGAGSSNNTDGPVYTIPNVGNTFTPDLSKGLNQYVLLTANSMINAPINVPAGTSITWTLIIDQDSAGGHNALLQPGSYFTNVNILGTALANTRSQTNWVTDQSGNTTISGTPSTDQPIP